MRKKSFRALAIIACILPTIAVAAGDVEIGLTGGAFSAFPDSRAYAASSNTTTTTGTNLSAGQLDEVRPRYRFGGGVNLTYQPCDDPIYWDLSWFGLNRKNTTHADGSVRNGRLPTLFGVDNSFSASAHSTLSMSYQFTAARVGIEKGICNDALFIKPHIGVAYLNEKEEQRTIYNNVGRGGAPSGTNATVVDNSEFNGLGPSIGTNLKFCVSGDFSLLGSVDYSPLIGRQKGFYSLTAAVRQGGTSSIPFNTAGTNAFVHHIQAELGLGYNLNFIGCDRGKIVLGWRLVNMTNVSRRLTVIPGNIDNRFASATVHGPFLRLNWGFNL